MPYMNTSYKVSNEKLHNCDLCNLSNLYNSIVLVCPKYKLGPGMTYFLLTIYFKSFQNIQADEDII